MTTDTELENWQREWREHTEPLPELKKKSSGRIGRRSGPSLVSALVWLSRPRGPSKRIALLWRAVRQGLPSPGLLWAVMRGGCDAVPGNPVRKPHWPMPNSPTNGRWQKRACFVFAFIFLLCTVVLFSGFLALSLRRIHPREMIIDAALIVELFYIKRQERRKLQEVEETKKLLSDIRE